jgi:two-component system cell cycle response regulator
MSARVLVVDDQPLNVKVIEAKLSSEYYEVLTATGGREALDSMSAVKPDIMLLDVMMPEMDGFEVCRRVKADPELMHIPVIMVTALSDPSDRVRGLEAGADDFLTKPINDDALFARIRSSLRLKMALDELRLRDHTSLQLGVIEAGEFDIESGAGGRVLVVEDDDGDADLIATELSRENTLVSVSTADEALAEAEDGPFDLVIVSIELRGSDGLRLCSQLRSRDETRHVPLLMLIEQNDANKLAKGLDLGVNDYLYKPIDRNELIARVRGQIRHNRYQERLRSTYHRSVSLAVTDSLTGLFNRLYLTSHLESLREHAIAEGKPLAVAMIDIDHFKAVNDAHGHDVGDAVLCELAQRLKSFVRASDLPARLGGEEFVVVMPDTDLSLAEVITTRLRKKVADSPFSIPHGKGDLSITVSIGVASLLGAEDTPEKLLKRADVALYEAKRGGRNRVIALAS